MEKGTMEKGTMEKGTMKKGTMIKGTMEKGTSAKRHKQIKEHGKTSVILMLGKVTCVFGGVLWHTFSFVIPLPMIPVRKSDMHAYPAAAIMAPAYPELQCYK